MHYSVHTTKNLSLLKKIFFETGFFCITFNSSILPLIIYLAIAPSDIEVAFIITPSKCSHVTLVLPLNFSSGAHLCSEPPAAKASTLS